MVSWMQALTILGNIPIASQYSPVGNYVLIWTGSDSLGSVLFSESHTDHLAGQGIP
jgi:hypothetical protein